MSGAIRVAVIGGGANGEHEVSLASAASATSALDPRRFEVVSFRIGRDGCWHLAGAPVAFHDAVAVLSGCDVVLPLVHGAPGEDGTLAALCELAGVPYVGSGVGAGALAMDKHATKLLAASLGIRTAAATLITAADRGDFAPDGPVVVKPVAAGSSRGVQLVRDPSGWAAALDDAFGYDDRVLVEEVVIGREIDVAVLGGVGGEEPMVSPTLEIHSAGFFDYDAKYGAAHETDVRFEVPAPLDPLESRSLEANALALYRALGCRGVARFDFFLTESGWVFNEANTVPGMTAHSQVPQMFAAAGIRYPELLERLIRDAMAGEVAERSVRA